MIPLLIIGVVLGLLAGAMFYRLADDSNDGDMGLALLFWLVAILAVICLAASGVIYGFHHFHFQVGWS